MVPPTTPPHPDRCTASWSETAYLLEPAYSQLTPISEGRSLSATYLRHARVGWRWLHRYQIDDVQREKKGANRCSLVFCSLIKQSCELSRHRNWDNHLAVFWLFVMFAESQIKAFKRDPEYCQNGCETFFGEPVIQAAGL